MRFLMGVVLALLLAPLTAAAERDGRITGPELVAILGELGYEAELDRDGHGDPLVLARTLGLDVRIFFYGCEDDACDSLQVRIGLDLDEGTTLEVLNRFQYGYRYARAYLDDENDPFLMLDFDLEHADPAAHVAAHMLLWEELLDAFTLAVGFREPREGEFSDVDADAISWPLATEPGSSLLYDSSFASVTSGGEPGERVEIQASGVVRIAMDADDGDGYLQRWVSSDTRVDSIGTLPEVGPVMEAAISALDGIALDVRLDGDGNFAALANMDEIQPLYRETMRRMFVDLGEVMSDEDTGGDMAAEVESMLDLLTSNEVLERQLSEQLVAYNFPAGGGLVPGREYAYQDEGMSPLGGDVIPMDNSMLLRASSEMPGHYELEWKLVPDPAATWAAIEVVARQLLGGVAGDDDEIAGLLEQTMSELGEDAEFSNRVSYRIDPATGIVHYMEHVATKRFGGREEVETSVLALRAPAP